MQNTRFGLLYAEKMHGAALISQIDDLPVVVG